IKRRLRHLTRMAPLLPYAVSWLPAPPFGSVRSPSCLCCRLPVVRRRQSAYRPTSFSRQSSRAFRDQAVLLPAAAAVEAAALRHAPAFLHHRRLLPRRRACCARPIPTEVYDTSGVATRPARDSTALVLRSTSSRSIASRCRERRANNRASERRS